MSQQDIYESWADVGIPGKIRIHQLLYNRNSDTLIVVAHKELQGRLSVYRLYYRVAAEAVYRPITVQDTLESQENPVCCEAAPFLIYNEMRFRPPEPDSSIFAADWICVRRFNFSACVSEVVLDGQSLQADSPYVSGWVSSIIAVWPDCSGAICKVGLQRPRDDGALSVDYFVYEISFKDGLRRQIAALPRVFL